MNPTQEAPSLVFVMLDLIQKEPNYAARVKKLRELRCRELIAVLQMNYRADVVFDLPPGAPKFQPDNGDAMASASRTRNVIGDFLELRNTNRSLSSAQKVSRFVRILESVNEREAEVFILAKDRKLQSKWPALNIHLVRDAIPGIV